jgi:sugar phosphate isomerase/epimerase
MDTPYVVSFMSANFVARELGYRLAHGWAEGDVATQDHFRPPATFAERFDVMLGEVQALGFDAIDLWGAHLHYSWATSDQVKVARRLLDRRGLRVVSYAGWVPGGEAELRAACRLCREIGAPLIGGYVELVSRDRAAAARILRENGVAYGHETHREKTPEEILARIGEGDEDVIGVTVDTGWLGTRGCDVVAVVRRIAPRMNHLHLKDVKPPRAEKTGLEMIDLGHETCRPGTGIVPVEALVKLLPTLGYRGAISIEHEPEEFDPRADCQAALRDVRAWLASASG